MSIVDNSATDVQVGETKLTLKYDLRAGAAMREKYGIDADEFLSVYRRVAAGEQLTFGEMQDRFPKFLYGLTRNMKEAAPTEDWILDLDMALAAPLMVALFRATADGLDAGVLGKAQPSRTTPETTGGKRSISGRQSHKVARTSRLRRKRY